MSSNKAIIDDRVKAALRARSDFRNEAISKGLVLIVLLPFLLFLAVYLFWMVGDVNRAATSFILVTEWVPDLHKALEGSIDLEAVRATAIGILGVAVSTMLALAAQGFTQRKFGEQVKASLWQRVILGFVYVLALLTAYFVVLGWISRPAEESVDDLAVGSVASVATLLFIMALWPSEDASDRYLRLGDIRNRRTIFERKLRKYFGISSYKLIITRTNICDYLKFGYALLGILIFTALLLWVARWFSSGNPLEFNSTYFEATFLTSALIAILHTVNVAYMYYIHTVENRLQVSGVRAFGGALYLTLFVMLQLLVLANFSDEGREPRGWLSVIIFTVIPVALLVLGGISGRNPGSRNWLLKLLFGPVWLLVREKLRRGASNADSQESQLMEELKADPYIPGEARGKA